MQLDGPWQTAQLLLASNQPQGKECKNILAEPPLAAQGPQAEAEARASASSFECTGNLACCPSASCLTPVPATGSRAGGPGLVALGAPLRSPRGLCAGMGKSLPHDVNRDLGNQLQLQLMIAVSGHPCQSQDPIVLGIVQTLST